MGRFISAHNKFLDYNHYHWNGSGGASFKEAHRLMLYCDSCGGTCGKNYNADYNEAQTLVKKAEGGYSNDPRDKGGETYKGISRVYHPKWSGWLIVDAYKAKHALKTNDVIPDKNLDALVEKFYQTEFWNAIKGDKIQSQKVANIIYDSAVNNGQGAAIKYVKDSLGISTYNVDEINKANPEKLFNEIGKRREADYKEKGGYALNSWISRLRALGYSGAEIVMAHKKATIAIILGIGILTTGIVIYNKNK